jgi:thymidylate synthase (FAD)
MSSVKLVSITTPIVDGLKTAEDLITYCARVSNPNNQLNTETAPKLIKYLITHSHFSPFEMVGLCVEIKTSRAIAAQILRHKSFAFQEFSGRYSKFTSIEPIEYRLQGKTNRQVGDEPYELSPDLKEKVDASLLASQVVYDELIAAGVAKECARMVLPLTTSTTMYMNGTVRSWIHYLQLRSKEDTQKEHRDIAMAIKDIFVQNFPNTAVALDWN